MHIVLFDDNPNAFLPLAYTRPIGDLRCGIFSNAERWRHHGDVFYHTREALRPLFPGVVEGSALYVNGRVIWHKSLRERALELAPGEAIVFDDVLVALHWNEPLEALDETDVSTAYELESCTLLDSVRDVFVHNGEALIIDFEDVIQTRHAAELSATNTLIGPQDRLFIGAGAEVEAATINTQEGPVYIGAGAKVMEGSMIRGGLALCDHAQLKMGTKIYGPSTFGPFCKVGGEVSNSVFQGYSNKGHDGFVGNSVIGQWCNLGADTNTSNLKNNYGTVKVWDFELGELTDSGLTFCGLMMGDHSKCSINTQFNTGTTVGVNANIFGHGFPPKYIPSFAWGGSDGFTTYELEKSYLVAERVCARRQVAFTPEDRALMAAIFEETAGDRN